MDYFFFFSPQWIPGLIHLYCKKVCCCRKTCHLTIPRNPSAALKSFSLWRTAKIHFNPKYFKDLWAWSKVYWSQWRFSVPSMGWTGCWNKLKADISFTLGILLSYLCRLRVIIGNIAGQTLQSLDNSYLSSTIV